MLTVTSLKFEYDFRAVLANVSFSLLAGEALAVTGPNGCGKSTLLKCLIGEIKPQLGSIQLKKGASMAYLEQAIGRSGILLLEFMLQDEPELSVLFSNLSQLHHESLEYADLVGQYAALGGFKFESRLLKKLQKFGFSEEDFTKPLAVFSEGEKQLFNLIRVLHSSAQILLLDEPTNHLDIEKVKLLESWIVQERNSGRAILFVSHDRAFIDRVATKTMSIEHGVSKIIEGGYSKLLEQNEKDYAQQVQASNEMNDRISKMDQEIRQRMSWSAKREAVGKRDVDGPIDRGFQSRRAAKMAKRAKAVETRQAKLIEELKENRVIVPEKINLKFEKTSCRERTVLRAENLCVSFGGNLLFQEVNLEINTTDRIGLIGANGSGKSTLMKVLVDRIKSTKGVCQTNPHVKFVYIEQDLKLQFLGANLVESLLSTGQDESMIRLFLGAAKLKGATVLQPISTLSQGELMRGAIVQAILSGCDFMFLDEPTNHLDIESLEVLDQLLDQFSGGFMVISHDRHFIEKSVKTVFELKDQRVKSTNIL